MVEDLLNCLALMAIHKDVKLDYEKILILYYVEYDNRLKLKNSLFLDSGSWHCDVCYSFDMYSIYYRYHYEL